MADQKDSTARPPPVSRYRFALTMRLAHGYEFVRQVTIHHGPPFQAILESWNFVLFAYHNKQGPKMICLRGAALFDVLKDEIDKEFDREFVWDDITFKFVDIEQELVAGTSHITITEST
jgi:hypothetical protein